MEGIAKDSCSSSKTDIVQHLLFPTKALEPVVIERSSGHCFTDVDSTWKALDCGLFGDNFARKGLLPMLKVYDKEAYVRLDAQYTFNFKQQDTSAAHCNFGSQQQDTSAASVHAQANAFPHQARPQQARLSPSKKAWLLEMTWATDREPEDYKAYDLTKDDQILEAFEGCVGQEPHSAWEMYKQDEAW
ncbi:TPA: hypothetical protein ACH3X1_001628 [Trebouxia sp. C0004]